MLNNIEALLLLSSKLLYMYVEPV